MPDRFQQTFHDGNTKARGPEHSYESVWMSHWMQTSCNSTSRVLNYSALPEGSKEEVYNTNKGVLPVQSVDPRKAARLDVVAGSCTASAYRNIWRCQEGSLKVASDVPSSSKADMVETEYGQAKITNDKVAMNPRSLSNARSQWHSFPVSSFNQNNDSVSTPITDLACCDRHMTKSQIKDTPGHGLTTVGTSQTNFPSRLYRLASSEVEFPAKDHYSQPVSITHCPIKCGKSYGSVEKKRLSLSESSLYDLQGSTSNTALCTYKSGGTTERSFMYRNKETDQSICPVASKGRSTNSNFTPSVQKNYNYCNYPTFLGCDKGKDNQLRAKHSGTSCLSQKDRTLQIIDPSASNFNFLISDGEQSKDINGFLGTGVSTRCSIPHRETELEESNPGSHLLQKMPACAVHDVETLRICTTVDSVEGVSGGLPKFSQTTHHLFITNKIGVNLSKWDQIIKESNLSADFNRNALHELLSLPSHCHVKHGARLQSLGNTTHTEGKEITRDVEKGCLPLNKDLSAQTDMMDIDDCDNGNSSHGIFSSPSNPVTAQATLVLPRKVGTGKTELEIPDTSRGPIAILAAKGSTGKRGISALRTEVEHLPHVEPAVYVNSSLQQDVPEAQPSYGLVKRPKLNASDSLAHGKKSSRNTSSGEKVNNLFTKIMSYNISSSEPTWSKKRQMELDKSVVLFRNLESSSMGSMKDDEDLTLSHPWIQRWCHSQAEFQLKKPTASVICEPKVSKPTSKKQLPSIAAMALMGKASNSYRPCEFRKKGPVIVWNTEVL